MLSGKLDVQYLNIKRWVLINFCLAHASWALFNYMIALAQIIQLCSSPWFLGQLLFLCAIFLLFFRKLKRWLALGGSGCVLQFSATDEGRSRQRVPGICFCKSASVSTFQCFFFFFFFGVCVCVCVCVCMCVFSIARVKNRLASGCSDQLSFSWRAACVWKRRRLCPDGSSHLLLLPEAVHNVNDSA